MKEIGFTIYNINRDPADKTGLQYTISNDSDGSIPEEDFVKSSRVVTLQPGETLSIREAAKP